jgi:hypothetical protein
MHAERSRFHSSMFTDPATVEKRMVPGMRAIRWERGYRVGVTHEAAAGVNEIVDSFFGIISDATGDAADKKKSIVGGFKVCLLAILFTMVFSQGSRQLLGMP